MSDSHILTAYNQGYRVTRGGIVLGPKGRSRKLQSARCGYLRFQIKYGKKKPHIRVHRLQAYQKFGDAALVHGVHVRHKDDNKQNNDWDNILIGTAKENMADKPPGTHQRVCAIARAAKLCNAGS